MVSGYVRYTRRECNQLGEENDNYVPLYEL
jgi:hypothetical protein